MVATVAGLIIGVALAGFGVFVLIFAVRFTNYIRVWMVTYSLPRPILRAATPMIYRVVAVFAVGLGTLMIVLAASGGFYH